MPPGMNGIEKTAAEILQNSELTRATWKDGVRALFSDGWKSLTDRVTDAKQIDTLVSNSVESADARSLASKCALSGPCRGMDVALPAEFFCEVSTSPWYICEKLGVSPGFASCVFEVAVIACRGDAPLPAVEGSGRNESEVACIGS